MLVGAFRGWNDGAQGASLATSFLAQAWEARRFANIDPEEFYDFQATRPHVALEEGITRRIDWPDTVFYHAPIPGADRDAVLMLGIEPNLRWRTFCDEIVELAGELDVELVVTLGALLADVPHTRPAPVTGSASDQKLVEELGHAAARYEGPTGLRSPRVRGPHSPSANGWRASSARSSTSATSSAPRPPTSSRSARRSRPTRRPRPTSRSSRRGAIRSGTSSTFPQETRSPRS